MKQCKLLCILKNVDIHGQSMNDFIMIGYKPKLKEWIEIKPPILERFSMRRLVEKEVELTQTDTMTCLEDIVKGTHSLSGLLRQKGKYERIFEVEQEMNYNFSLILLHIWKNFHKVLPLPSGEKYSDPLPFYFNGGDAISFHGSMYGGNSDAVQFEIPRKHREKENYKQFCQDLGDILKEFLNCWYDLDVI